jgi:hypothetical protein
MTSKVRVPSTALALGGWKGRLDADGDVLRVVGEDPSNRFDIDCAQIKRCSFNKNNGLWAFRMSRHRPTGQRPHGGDQAPLPYAVRTTPPRAPRPDTSE